MPRHRIPPVVLSRPWVQDKAAITSVLQWVLHECEGDPPEDDA